MGKRKVHKPETVANQAKISSFFKKRSEGPLFTTIGSSSIKNTVSNVHNTLTKKINELDDSVLEIIEATPEIKPKPIKLTNFPKSSLRNKESISLARNKPLKTSEPSDDATEINTVKPRQKRAADWRTGRSPNCKRQSDADMGEITDLNKNSRNRVGSSLDFLECSPVILGKSRKQQSSTSGETSLSQTILTPASPFFQKNQLSKIQTKEDVSRNLFGESFHEKPQISEVTCDSKVKNESNICVGEELMIPDDCLADLLTDSFDRMSPFKKTPVEDESKEIKKHVKEGLCSDSFAVTQGFNRHIVVSVHQDVYKQELNLCLKSIQNGSSATCCLSGSWYESSIKEDDIVHLLFTQPENGHYTISNKKGLIVINPDLMISGTSVVAGVFCRRKAVLNERFKGLEGTNRVMIIGTLVHEIFQEVVKRKKMTKQQLNDLVTEVVSERRILLDLYGLGVTQADIKKDVSTFVPFIHKWSNDYLNNTPTGSKAKKWPGTITAVRDIEENIWSPRFGVKGKIDLTVQTKKNGIDKVMPLELKTGKSTFSVEHKGQVTLYSMMSSDRREDPLSGLLLYLKDGSMSEVPAGENEKRGLIQLRNEIVSYLFQRVPQNKDGKYELAPLPEPIDNDRVCSKCPQLSTCTAYSAIQNQKYESGHTMVKFVPENIQHLTKDHLEYFRKWCLMLHLEKAADSRNSLNRGLWCMSSEKREAAGDCISNVTIDEEEIVAEISASAFLHTFKRNIDLYGTLPVDNFNVGDYVILSSARDLCVSAGSIMKIESNSLQIVLDKNLASYSGWRRKLFRVDRCEFGSTMGIVYSNLALLIANNEKSETLRKLIIDKETPIFDHGFRKEQMPLIKPILKNLNKNQQRAILRILLARDYAVLQGYPGTGKTSTIVCLVRVLVKLGQSVLVASNTHSAVDNILLKLKDYNDTNILRLGKATRIHRDILEFSEEKLTRKCRTVEEISDCFEGKNVVGTTCLGANHVIFTKRTFDVCVIDEAGQALQVATLGPLTHCKKFVLVGDSLQLPPIVQSHAAKSMGMMESLLERLATPSSTISLTKQYRMNEPIMNVANQLIYNNQLECANEELRIATLTHSNPTVPPWLMKPLSNALEDSVVFLNTNKCAPEEKNMMGHPVNPHEMRIVGVLLENFVSVGVPVGEIGIITPYRGQVKLLKGSVENSPWKNVEVNTVDQFQGRDKQVIIYSAVRSNELKEVQENEILQDLRRLNVATTRAKFKLIIIGDRGTLNNYKPFQSLFKILTSDQIYNIEPGKDGYKL